MNCPYCAEEIKDEAVVCKHCRRDFFIIRPLLNTLNEMSKRIEILESNAVGPPRLADSSNAPSSGSRLAQAVAVGPVERTIPSIAPIGAMALCIIALVVAHFFIIVQFDLQLRYLRIALFVLPLLFGLTYRDDGQRQLLREFGAGLLIATMSTLAMLVIVSKTDGGPILPNDVQQWREFGYYVASISFGFFTGALIRQTVIAARSPMPNNRTIFAQTSRYIAAKMDSGDETKLEKSLKRIHAALSSSIAVSSAVISIVSSLGITGN